MNIKQLSEDDRPREKMVRYGVEALTKSELFAVLVGSGNEDENAVMLMQKILKDTNDSIRTLGAKSIEELCEYRGIGPAKAMSIKAACQIAKLMQAEKVERRTQFVSSVTVWEYFAPRLADKTSEEVWALLLNMRMEAVGVKQISKGGISESTVDIRLILREAILSQATSIILVHNHPTGHPLPSKPDDRLTEKLKNAAEIMNITLQDHVIVGGDSYYSYRNEAKIL